MESVYLFGFDNDIQSYYENREIKEKQELVLKYANNNNNEIKLNHTSNIFLFASRINNLYKFRFFIKLLSNFKDYQDLFGSNFISVANTGEDETMKDIENILKTYVDPFKVKDGREKTEKELARSKAQKAKLNQDIQDILQSDQIQNIINSSVSKEEAQSKINAFIK